MVFDARLCRQASQLLIPFLTIYNGLVFDQTAACCRERFFQATVLLPHHSTRKLSTLFPDVFDCNRSLETNTVHRIVHEPSIYHLKHFLSNCQHQGYCLVSYDIWWCISPAPPPRRSPVSYRPGITVHSMCVPATSSGFESETILLTPRNPYDNSVCESFFHTLKKEALYHYLYETPQELEEVLDEYIDFYNGYRPHGKLNMKTPIQYEAEFFSATRG